MLEWIKWNGKRVMITSFKQFYRWGDAEIPMAIMSTYRMRTWSMNQVTKLNILRTVASSRGHIGISLRVNRLKAPRAVNKVLYLHVRAAIFRVIKINCQVKSEAFKNKWGKNCTMINESRGQSLILNSNWRIKHNMAAAAH